jgi:methyltransferase (TIGR00027 family)
MDSKKSSDEELADISKWFKEQTGPGNKTAERVAILRAGESMRPADKRICFDPYAIHFISPSILEWAANNPEEVRLMQERTDRLVPGLDNSIITRVRYFDDFIIKLANEGLEQLVILGAGYDSRPYRIDCLKNIKIFEVDHPATQVRKIEKIKKIFGSLPGNVTYVAANLSTEDLGQRLQEKGYARSLKTLFIMEGLLMYLSPESVDEILSFIKNNSGKGSTILFDYYPRSVVDGTSTQEAGRNIYNQLMQLGEPLRFGIHDGKVGEFLADRGFSQARNVTSQDYERIYLIGANKGRIVSSLLNFAHASVE